MTVLIITTGINSLCDLILSVFPIVILWALQMPTRRKLQLYAVLSTSYLALIASIIKTVRIGELSASHDFTCQSRHIKSMNIANQNRELCQSANLGCRRGQYHHNHRKLPMSVSLGQAMVQETRLYSFGFREAVQLLLGLEKQRKDCAVYRQSRAFHRQEAGVSCFHRRRYRAGSPRCYTRQALLSLAHTVVRVQTRSSSRRV